MVDRFPEIASVEEFIRLRRSEDPAECDRSAWAAMPLTVWWQLVREHPEMRFWAAHNRTCPPEILAELIKDADWRVRDRVLGKGSCPPELWSSWRTILTTQSVTPWPPIPVRHGLLSHGSSMTPGR
ncbi:hypothetical protein ACIQK5_26660 [Streptomyces virginiae]|uniref:hypothetical protein n=1 Tax=Streptomyces virginiae TaxID=1961 RepID=UPI003803AAD4